MIRVPQCSARRCRYFLGVRNDGTEETERVFCAAFHDRIPDRIAYGEDLHEVAAPGQDEPVAFEVELQARTWADIEAQREKVLA